MKNLLPHIYYVLIGLSVISLALYLFYLLMIHTLIFVLWVGGIIVGCMIIYYSYRIGETIINFFKDGMS